MSNLLCIETWLSSNLVLRIGMWRRNYAWPDIMSCMYMMMVLVPLLLSRCLTPNGSLISTSFQLLARSRVSRLVLLPMVNLRSWGLIVMMSMPLQLFFRQGTRPPAVQWTQSSSIPIQILPCKFFLACKFVGIDILRDRAARKMYLSHTAS